MKIVRCQNGHFYDSDLYCGCPHCGKKETEAQNKVREDYREYRKAEKAAEKKKKKIFALPQKKDKKEKNAQEASCAEYSCEPTTALSASELAYLFPDGKDDEKKSPEGHKSEPLPAEKAEKPSVPSSPADESAAGETKTPEHDVPKDIKETEDKRKAFECPETVGWFSTKSGEREPCVGWLCGVSGPYRGRSFELKAGGNFIGRAPDNDIVLAEDNRVSRHKHARVAFEPRTGEFYIEVGESSGLAYRNGENILHHAALSVNDVIEIGGGSYIFVPLCSSDFSWDHYPQADSICRGTPTGGGDSL